jgi:cupin superfamily acireductone dioxygenase involved in methionine salvage
MAQSEGLSENLRRKEAEFERYKVSAEQRHQAALEELNSKLKTEVNMIQSTSGPELFNRVEISAQTDNFGEDSEVEELRCKLSEVCLKFF